MDKAHFSQHSRCVFYRGCALPLTRCGGCPVNHPDCVFLSESPSVLVLAPNGGRPFDSNLTVLLQLQTGRKSGSTNSLRLGEV